MSGDHHDGQRVSRSALVRGISALSFSGLLGKVTEDKDGYLTVIGLAAKTA